MPEIDQNGSHFLQEHVEHSRAEKHEIRMKSTQLEVEEETKDKTSIKAEKNDLLLMLNHLDEEMNHNPSVPPAENPNLSTGTVDFARFTHRKPHRNMIRSSSQSSTSTTTPECK
jgi:hypothetical protein